MGNVVFYQYIAITLNLLNINDKYLIHKRFQATEDEKPPKHILDFGFCQVKWNSYQKYIPCVLAKLFYAVFNMLHDNANMVLYVYDVVCSQKKHNKFLVCLHTLDE